MCTAPYNTIPKRYFHLRRNLGQVHAYVDPQEYEQHPPPKCDEGMVGKLFSFQTDRSAIHFAQTCKGFNQFTLSVAVNPCNTHNFSSTHIQIQIVKNRDTFFIFGRQLADLKYIAPGVAGFLSTLNVTLRPTIFSASSFGFVSEVLTESMTLPRRIIVTVSEISIISFSLCVIRIIDLPSATSFS